jgi:hypothetical protein
MAGKHSNHSLTPLLLSNRPQIRLCKRTLERMFPWPIFPRYPQNTKPSVLEALSFVTWDANEVTKTAKKMHAFTTTTTDRANKPE